MIHTFRTPTRTSWWPSERASLSLSKVHGNYFVKITILADGVGYHIHSCKTGRLVLNMLIRDTGESVMIT
jgi:hypothetical protein